MPTWDQVEKKISEEMEWLDKSISRFYRHDDHGLIKCKNCLLRKIAILIVSGKVKAREINKSTGLVSFWNLDLPLHEVQKNLPKIFHGQKWHSEIMTMIENHFLHQECAVTRERALHWGRADLGIYKESEKNLFVEVGTVSLEKVWINLNAMENIVYLLVLDDQKLIEFMT